MNGLSLNGPKSCTKTIYIVVVLIQPKADVRKVY